MIKARDDLMVKKKKDVYTDTDIEGLGKNYMKESSRTTAINAAVKK